MMVALRQHLPRPFNSAMAVHCANYFQMVLLRRVFSSSLAQPTFPICPNKKPATSSRGDRRLCRRRQSRSVYRRLHRLARSTLHFDVGLVHSPGTICHLKMGPHTLIDLRRVVLRPARHGRVIDGNASIGQHPLKVSIADRKLKVPTHRPKDHVSRKMTASELIFALIHRSGPAPRSRS